MNTARKAVGSPMPCYEDASWVEIPVPLAKRPTKVVVPENLLALMARMRPAWKQQDLATAVGKSQATVSRWLDGISDVSFEDLDKLSTIFDVPVIAFFRDLGDPRGLDFDEEDAFKLLRERIRDRKRDPEASME